LTIIARKPKRSGPPKAIVRSRDDATAWNGLYAPAGTPDAIIQTLNKALQDVLADPGLKKHALDLGIDVKASTPAELDARRYRQVGKSDRRRSHCEAVDAGAAAAEKSTRRSVVRRTGGLHTFRNRK
jgi:hypothetical protein